MVLQQSKTNNYNGKGKELLTLVVQPESFGVTHTK